MVDLNQDGGEPARDRESEPGERRVDEAPEEGSALELPKEIQDTVSKLREGDPDTVIAFLDGASTPSTLTQRKQPPAPDGGGRRLGPYEIHKLLGQGGIGMVYHAFDHRLERWVALKLVRADSEEAARRLLGEAKAQARVDHPNVCQVYEAGEIGGEPFIAMQYLEGKPLGKVYPQMTLREKIEVTRKVAEAIHAAHLQGLIHRDIKPGNVMVEQTESGKWRPYVLDFGLAREVSAPGDTTTGEVKGTPHYMPPEQVTGDVHQLDERADVYSLGATFYEGLVGCTLYPTTTGVAVLVKVLSEDPEPVRSLDKSLPVDVESIVMHCLERDPAKRYPSAKALADDLQRFLDFEPVEARKITAFGRLWRKLRKRRVAALTVMLIATILLSIVFFAVSRVRAAKRAQLMETFRQEVRYNDRFLRHAYSAPLHDVNEQKETIRTKLANLEERDVAWGRIGQGPKNYALGGGYLALHDYEKAHEHLREAWRLGTRDPEVAYALGRTLGALYEQELRAAKRIDNASQREARLAQIQAEYRQPALAYLRAGRGVESESTELVEALLLFWEERYDEALAKAEQGLRRVPWLYEGKVLQGHVYAALGSDGFTRGDYEEAMENYRQAQRLYDEAALLGRSDSEIYEGQCHLGAEMMRLQSYAFDAPLGEFFDYGVEACKRARRVDDERHEPFSLQSLLYYRMGEDLLYKGIDPKAQLRQAAELAAEALERDPDNVLALANQGWSNNLLADWQVQHGGDPRDAAGRARKLFARSVEVDPQFAQGYNGQGYARYVLARWQMEHGVNPRPAMEAAIDDFQHAVAIEPEYFYPHDTLANCYNEKARWLLWQGEDPLDSVAAVERVSARMLELNPRYSWAHSVFGDVLEIRSRYLLESGEDPIPGISRSRQALAAAEELQSRALIDVAQARLLATEATWRAGNGAADDDVVALFEQARAELERAKADAPEDPVVWQAAAEVALTQARWEIAGGRSASRTIQRGLDRVTRTLEINSDLTEIRAVGARLKLLRARASGSRRDEAAVLAELEGVFEENGNLRRRYADSSEP